jgi:hypothetical protein
MYTLYTLARHVFRFQSEIRRAHARKVGEPVAVNNRPSLGHGHDSKGHHRVHPLVRAPTRCLERDLREVLDLVLRDGQGLALLRRPATIHAVDTGSSRHSPHGIDQDEVAVVRLERVPSIELGRRLPETQLVLNVPRRASVGR